MDCISSSPLRVPVESMESQEPSVLWLVGLPATCIHQAQLHLSATDHTTDAIFCNASLPAVPAGPQRPCHWHRKPATCSLMTSRSSRDVLVVQSHLTMRLCGHDSCRLWKGGAGGQGCGTVLAVIALHLQRVAREESGCQQLWLTLWAECWGLCFARVVLHYCVGPTAAHMVAV